MFKKIKTEFQLISKSEVLLLKKELIISFFQPLSLNEKIEMLVEYISKMEAVQKQIDKSYFAKYFVDWRDDIATKQQELYEKKHEFETTGNCISFSTLQLHSIVASETFLKEQLFDFAELVDQSFTDDEEILLLFLEKKDNEILLSSTPSNVSQEFATQVSKEVFQRIPVIIVEF